MAVELRQFTATIPAGTPKIAPQVFSMEMPAREVDNITIIVPPGPRGNVGIQVAMSGQQVMPFDAGEYLVTDNEVIQLPIDDLPNSGDWELIGYNTGSFDHTIQIRYYVDLVAPQTTFSPGLISIASVATPEGAQSILGV